MKKVYLLVFAAFVFLIALIIISLFVNTKKNPISQQGSTILPTTVPLPGTAQKSIQSIGTVDNQDFKAQYSPSLNKIVVEEKTPQARSSFYQWAGQNNLNNVVLNGDNVVFTKSSESLTPIPTPTTPVDDLSNRVKSFLDLLNLLNSSSAVGSGEPVNTNPISTPSPTPRPNIKNQSDNSGNSSSVLGGKIYYSQCSDQYGNVGLQGGTLCQCGCGETTVAMIASSYLGQNISPQKIVDIYRSNGYSMCGSYAGDAKSVLDNLGLQTTDYIVNEDPPVSQSDVVPILRKYLNAGWTFFALTYYKPNDGGGHYFWITGIDNSGNILAYDPYYGQYSSPPLNENQYSPFPEYSQIFGVKLK